MGSMLCAHILVLINTSTIAHTNTTSRQHYIKLKAVVRRCSVISAALSFLPTGNSWVGEIDRTLIGKLLSFYVGTLYLQEHNCKYL